MANDLRIYVDNNEVDYNSNSDLPFDFSDKIDDLDDAGVVKISSIVNIADSLVFPASNKNRQIFKNTDTKSLKVVKGSQQIASARISVNEVVKRYGLETEYLCDVFGGNADLIERLNDVNLRDLDLGNQLWDDTEVQNSWSGTVATYKGVFAPILYGATIDNVNFTAREVRFHVYFDAIMQGIADYLKVSLSSVFFDTCPIWLKAVNVFTAGESLRRANFQNFSRTLTATGQTQLVGNVPSFGGEYVVTISIPSGGSGVLDHIRLTTSDGFSVDVLYNNTQSLQYITVPIFIATGGNFTVEGQTFGNVPTDLPLFTHFDCIMQKGGSGVFGGEVIVSSFLPDASVLDWLKSIFQMFNLVSHFDSIIKKWTIEPRFDYVVNGASYKGFYNNIKDGNFSNIDYDGSLISESLFYKNGTIKFNFESNKIFKDRIEGENTSTLLVNSVESNINNNSDVLEVENKFYQNSYLLSTSLSNTGLLSCLPSDFKFKDGSLPTATFENKPQFAFVSEASLTLSYDNAATSVPFLMQSNQYDDNNDYSLSYCDTAYNVGVNSYTAKGLCTIFYQSWLSSLFRYKKISLKVNIKKINDIENFKKIYIYNNELYLLNSIDNFPIESQGLSDCTFFKISGVYLNDSDLIVSNSVLPVFSL
jgi:hypothetical protein